MGVGLLRIWQEFVRQEPRLRTQNRTVLGSKFADLFKQQLGDTRSSDLLDLINANIPTGVILFEVPLGSP